MKLSFPSKLTKIPVWWFFMFRNDKDGEELVSVNIGFVLKMLWGTKISLDGDGGFR